MIQQQRCIVLIITFLLCNIVNYYIVTAQTIGTDLCACQPRSYTFQLNFALTCDDKNITNSPGIAQEPSCVTRGDGSSDVTDKVPILVQTMQIIELNQNLLGVAQAIETGNFEDGSSITYTSIIDQGAAINTTSLPRGIQILMSGENALGQSLVTVFIVTFNNNCSIYPAVEDGATIGWAVFTNLIPPPQAFCPLAPAPPSDAPSSSPGVLSEMPSSSPSIAPVVTSDAPSASPSEAPSASPSEAPIVVQSESPSTSPIVTPTSDIPSSTPSTVPDSPIQSESPSSTPVQIIPPSLSPVQFDTPSIAPAGVETTTPTAPAVSKAPAVPTVSDSPSAMPSVTPNNSISGKPTCAPLHVVSMDSFIDRVKFTRKKVSTKSSKGGKGMEKGSNSSSTDKNGRRTLRAHKPVVECPEEPSVSITSPVHGKQLKITTLYPSISPDEDDNMVTAHGKGSGKKSKKSKKMKKEKKTKD